MGTATTLVVHINSEITRIGIKAILKNVNMPIEIIAEPTSTVQTLEVVATHTPDVLLIETDAAQCDLIDLINRLSPTTKMLVTFVPSDAATLKRCLKANIQAYFQGIPSSEKLILALESLATGAVFIDADKTTILETRDNDDKQLAASLSRRQKEVFERILSGRNNSEIAAELMLTVSTVKHHVQGILRVYNAKSRVDLIQKALFRTKIPR